MPPVRSVNVERTPFRLPPGTVASGRKCLTDSRGCCPVAPVEGDGDCGTGSGAAREWELPETVYLTILSTVPAASPPHDGGSGAYAYSLLQARQIFSRVFPLRYMTAEEIGEDPWRVGASVEGSWYWSQNIEPNANATGEPPFNGLLQHVTGYPFGQLAWSGNRPGFDGSGTYACGTLRGYVSAAPGIFDGNWTPGEGFLNSGHFWTPGYFNHAFAAYTEPDDSWTFLQGTWDWISRFRGVFCSISTSPPGPPRPRRVSFRSAPLPGRLRLDYEEVSLPMYPREAVDRPWESGTVYLERPAEAGNWFAETRFWGVPARFVLLANRIPLNEVWQTVCFNGWGLAFQAGDIARLLPEDGSLSSSYPWYYIGNDAINLAGVAGSSPHAGFNAFAFMLSEPCMVQPGGAACGVDPLDVTFYLRYTVFYDMSNGINNQWPVQNSYGLVMRCRLREAW